MFLRQANKTGKGSTAGAKALPAGSDRINLSAQAAEMQKAKEMCKSVPELRPERVEEIKAALAAGEYRVAAADVAEMIIGRSIADKLK